ncbi:MAG: hypothetical protein KGJ13_03220 [Patescibacteria group bacterium]|nr:hypothetical protein [Patescibacteria group bacterium]
MPNTTEVAVTNETTHPLFSREVRPMNDWAEFLERWQAAATINEMLGILHSGFTVSLGRRSWGEKEYDRIDRILFYLGVADGWADPLSALRKPGESYETMDYYDADGGKSQKSVSDLRQVVAAKAFDMLCVNVFKKADLTGGGRHGEDFNEDWEAVFTADRLFPAIQSFYRSETDPSIYRREVIIRNLVSRRESSHNEKFAHEFLANLAQFVWGWKEYWANDERKKEMHARLDPAKPWMTEVLIGMDRLDILRKFILILDDQCLARLRGIAFRNILSQYRNNHVKADRKVTTLDEACYVGSRAAWFLKEHELIVREDKRLAAIREAEDRREELNQQIRELSQKK